MVFKMMYKVKNKVIGQVVTNMNMLVKHVDRAAVNLKVVNFNSRY